MDISLADIAPSAAVDVDRRKRVATMILSDERFPDRSGDVVVTSGIDCREHRANPVGLFSHQKNVPVGMFENRAGAYTVRQESHRLIGDLHFAGNKIGEQCFSAVAAGLLRGCSIGFYPTAGAIEKSAHGGNVYRKCKLLEASLVCIPDNAEALVVKIEKACGGGRLAPALEKSIKDADPGRRRLCAELGVRSVSDEDWRHWCEIAEEANVRAKVARLLGRSVSDYGWHCVKGMMARDQQVAGRVMAGLRLQRLADRWHQVM